MLRHDPPVRLILMTGYHRLLPYQSQEEQTVSSGRRAAAVRQGTSSGGSGSSVDFPETSGMEKRCSSFVPDGRDSSKYSCSGLFQVDPYMGDARFQYATVWPVKKQKKTMLDDGLGYRVADALRQGGFATITRVVAATADGLPKVIISNATNAMSKERGRYLSHGKMMRSRSS